MPQISVSMNQVVICRIFRFLPQPNSRIVSLIRQRSLLESLVGIGRGRDEGTKGHRDEGVEDGEVDLRSNRYAEMQQHLSLLPRVLASPCLPCPSAPPSLRPF